MTGAGRGWALADEGLAPGTRSVATAVRDGAGRVRSAMNVAAHAAETSVDRLLSDHLPRLLRTAGELSAEWALWQTRPHLQLVRRDGPAGHSPTRGQSPAGVRITRGISRRVFFW